jgi:hemerythrin-like domain-containing protein
MIPTEILTDEHRLILTVCGAAEREAQSMRADGAANRDRVVKMLDFFRAFADRCHHAKEENLLFVRMTEKGMPRDFGPIGMMLHEHEQSRANLRAVDDRLADAAAGDAAALAAVSANLLAYASLLRAHILKEDNILYPMANQAFTAADQAALAADFERVERDEIGADVHERYERIARELAGE